MSTQSYKYREIILKNKSRILALQIFGKTKHPLGKTDVIFQMLIRCFPTEGVFIFVFLKNSVAVIPFQLTPKRIMTKRSLIYASRRTYPYAVIGAVIDDTVFRIEGFVIGVNRYRFQSGTTVKRGR